MICHSKATTLPPEVLSEGFAEQFFSISLAIDLIEAGWIKIAKKQHSTMFSQFAARISSEMRFGSCNKADIFAKIIGCVCHLFEQSHNAPFWQCQSCSKSGIRLGQG